MTLGEARGPHYPGRIVRSKSSEGSLTLRTIVLTASVAIAVTAGLACAVLVGLGAMLDDRIVDLEESMASQRIAARLDHRLLVQQLSTSPSARAVAESEIRPWLSEARLHVQSAEEAAILDDLEEALDEYWSSLAEAQGSERFARALEDVNRLWLVNQRQQQAARDAATRTQARARLIGGFGVAVIVLLTTGLLAWLRRLAFQPVFAVLDAMARFAAGDLTARAPERGPAELRVLALTTNQLADGLARMRRQQLEYIAGVVHDLRNPLAAVQLAAAYVSPSRALPPERRIREIFSMIARQLKRMNSLVGDVLNAVRLDAGVFELLPQPTDLRELVSEAVTLFQTMAPTHAIRVELPQDGPRAWLLVTCDPKLIEQVLNNLLSNAIKYSSPGSRVTVRLEAEGDGAVLEVQDEGRGIAQEELQSIFQPFHRGFSAHEEASGVGLGLYVSRRVVEAHGGQLTVESRMGSGSTFRVSLPLEGPKRIAREKAAPPAPRLLELGGA